ncbi:hypothetical protein SAMN05421852_1166 [Thermoflavimicrobium dichotomicum]|uniref:Uncharacterized protein n=1 Tax=Thermoflavimicrobium dichotomicum TaxID=46223 RepID=A0A1I3T6U4_9BACL|nr:hypothetical protein SAMN05421852_1166 [Thermoflavimicrobium dichotomicum]
MTQKRVELKKSVPKKVPVSHQSGTGFLYFALFGMQVGVPTILLNEQAMQKKMGTSG